MNDTEAHSPALGVATAPSTDGEAVAARAAGERRSRWLSVGPTSVAALIALLSILLPVGWSGLWAPHELEVADFSRRIGVALHGADALSVPGGNNSVPTLTELGKGQLPFSSIALGFQLFGLADWAGRLPLALWALAGIAATFALVSRLYDRVAAAYAAAALATVPLYFLHARTMLGDGVTLAAAALATSGLGLSVFRVESRIVARIGWGLLGLVGLLAGFGARGVLIGVSVPALGVGLAWLLWRLSGRALPARTNEVAGAASLGIGLVALSVGVWVLLGRSPDLYLELLGASSRQPATLPTHDAVLHQLGFGLFPWSAFAPFAVAVALAPDGAEGERPSALRACLLSVVVVALALHGISAPYVGVLPFAGTFALAALVGVAFRDAENPARRTRLLALSAAAIFIVLLTDLRAMPEQSLRAFALTDASFPESFIRPARGWIKYGTLACVALMLLALGDLPSDRERLGRPGSDSRRWLDGLRAAWGGRLRWLLGVLTLSSGALALGARLAQRGVVMPSSRWLEARVDLLSGVFLAVPALVFGPPLALLLRDALGAFLRWLPMPRARLGWLAFAGFALTLSLGYYPALAAQLSPRTVFESFRHQAKPGEPLAVLGQAASVAPYYSRAAVHTPKNAREGLSFLLEAPAERRWLVFGSKELGTLNQLYRQRVTPARNLPVLDALSSEVLLASNQLLPGEVNANPLSTWITNQRPAPQHPLDVDLNGQLRCIGWALTERDGTPVREASTGEPYDFRIYYEVLAPVTGAWKTFIHIDMGRRRFNGDHDTLEGKYPFRLWTKGDFVMDVHPVEFEPHFAGSTYQVYFGLFSGKKRMPVKRGEHSDNRIAGGPLFIR